MRGFVLETNENQPSRITLHIFWVTLPFAGWGQTGFAALCSLSTIKSTVTNRLLNLVDAKLWNDSNTNQHYAEKLAAWLQMTSIVLLKMFPWSLWTFQYHTGFVFTEVSVYTKNFFPLFFRFMYNWSRDVWTSYNVQDSLDFIHTTSSNSSWNLFGSTSHMTSGLTWKKKEVCCQHNYPLFPDAIILKERGHIL